MEDTSQDEAPYIVPQAHSNVPEVRAPSPVRSPDIETLGQSAIEEGGGDGNQDPARPTRSTNEPSSIETSNRPRTDDEIKVGSSRPLQKASESATQFYTISNLIFFAILGTLARLGLQALTFYPGAPVVFSEVWANFGGSLFMGFLSEDRMLFKEEWGTPTYHQQLEEARLQARNQEESPGSSSPKGAIDLAAAKKTHSATKKTIPLYIGLATGFCGSFTSFSSFMRDVFLALSNDLRTPLDYPGDYSSENAAASTIPRNGGYSFMALLAVIIITVALSMSGLYFGAHLAIFLEPYTPSLPYSFTRKVLDRAIVVLAWGSWLGAIFLSIWPPDRFRDGPDVWRGRAVFALVFAPLGCLGRFYVSLHLNRLIPSFPLGTFVVNIFGTAVLGMCWDLQHVPMGGVVGCQVLQGIQDGFCGCLTTVSTWVSELGSLKRGHAYRYGVVSVMMGLCFLVVIMGSLRWTQGFAQILCIH